MLLAFEAEQQTGMTARMVDAVLNPEMTCQLGKQETAVIDKPPIDKVFAGFSGSVTYFRLFAYGRNWEEAVCMVKRKAARK